MLGQDLMVWFGLWCLTPLSFTNKTDCNDITENIVENVAKHPSTNHHKLGFGLTKLVVIGIDCMGSCKSNYHMITTAPGSR